MKTKSRIMAVNALGNFLPVLRPQIPEHEVRSLGCRKIGEPVDSAVLSNPVSGVHMVRMHLFGEPRPDGLFGREKALLRLGYFEQSSSGFLVRTRHCIIPQLCWGIMHPNSSAAQLDPAEFMYITDYKQVNKKILALAIPQLSWGIVQSPFYCPEHAAFFGHLTGTGETANVERKTH